jgi:hypothetical protein
MKYLLDSLQSFETGHGNVLHPIPLGTDQSFMGEHLATQPASGEQVQQISERVDRKLDEMMKTITTTLSSHAQPAPNIPDPSISFTGPERVSHTQLRASRAVSVPYTLPNVTESTNTSRETSPSERGTSSEPGVVISPTFRRYNFAIPDLGRAPGAWQRAIKQWEEVDPITNHALRDWPKEWYEGKSATVSKRNQRKTIFEEYVRYAAPNLNRGTLTDSVFLISLGRDKNLFISKYPDADKSISKLLEAIRWNNGTTRSSKYGTASERKSKSPESPEPADARNEMVVD